MALWYCPAANPYPYVVALGFDPLWEDRSFGFFLTTRPVSFTKYKTDFFGPFSYAGASGNRGYALFSWTSRDRANGAKVQGGVRMQRPAERLGVPLARRASVISRRPRVLALLTGMS